MKQRELKFRVWCKNDGGFFWESPEGFSFSYRKSYKGEWYFAPFGISPETVIVQQYTGIKDKNGREIYEGDIIRSTWETNNPYGYSPDEWDERSEEDVVKYVAPEFTIFEPIESSQTAIRNFCREVVGNIFENP